MPIVPSGDGRIGSILKTMSDKKINVAIVGLGFGAEFIPIYQRHPNANMYAICQRTKEKLDQVGSQYGVEKRFTSFEELLKDPKVDAVHINSPIHLHAPQSHRGAEGRQACGLHRARRHDGRGVQADRQSRRRRRRRIT